jgi:hypothetical protein
LTYGFDRTEADELRTHLNRLSEQIALYRSAAPNRTAQCEEHLKKSEQCVSNGLESLASPYLIDEAKTYLSKAQEHYHDRML